MKDERAALDDAYDNGGNPDGRTVNVHHAEIRSDDPDRFVEDLAAVKCKRCKELLKTWRIFEGDKYCIDACVAPPEIIPVQGQDAGGPVYMAMSPETVQSFKPPGFCWIQSGQSVCILKEGHNPPCGWDEDVRPFITEMAPHGAPIGGVPYKCLLPAECSCPNCREPDGQA